LPAEVSVTELEPPETPKASSAARLASDLTATLITFDRPRGLRRLVDSLGGQHLLPGRVLVVDNGRDPETADYVQGLAAKGCAVTLVTPPRNVGPAGATALAMTLALTGDAAATGWLTILNDDLVFSSASILDDMTSFARACAERDPRIAAVGRIGHRFDRAWARLRRPPEADRAVLPPVIDVDYLTTGSAWAGTGQPVPMLRLAAVREVGPFWADLFIGMTEVEYGLRLRRGGYRLVANGAMWRQERPPDVPPDPAGGTVERTPRRRYYSVRNLIVIARVYGRWWTPAWVTLSRIAARLLGFLRRPGARTARHLRATVAGVADGWRSRLGERAGRGDGAS
jgi:rhamnosyltransferase